MFDDDTEKITWGLVLSKIKTLGFCELFQFNRFIKLTLNLMIIFLGEKDKTNSDDHIPWGKSEKLTKKKIPWEKR